MIKTYPGPGGGFADGCSCPYRIALKKRIEPPITIPCGEVTVTYTFYNTSGTAHGQKTFYDEFPPDFTITEILRKPQCIVESGPGSNVLSLSGMEVLLDRDSIVILVRVGPEPGTYYSQAVAGDFPLGLGIDIPSDNPHTPEPEDPTEVTVAGDGNLIPNRTPKICPDGAAVLTAAANGISYLWSNGMTDAAITVSEPGLYWVEVLGTCGLYRDTVWAERAEPPWIDLGEDRILPFGHSLLLTHTNSAGGNGTFSWSATGAALNCLECPNPQTVLSEPSVFAVTLTDGNGCTATDEMRASIRENRDIYFPNAFSPNGDGINDLFYPQSEGDFLIKHLRVYDRWGGLLFEKTEGRTNDPTFGWDGNARKRQTTPGTYLWEAIIEFPGGERTLFKGEITVAR